MTLSPQIQYSEVTEDTLLLSFDKGLETDIYVPTESFKVNYGKIGIISADYEGPNQIVMRLDSPVGPRDIVTLSYEPPLGIQEALRSYVPAGSPVSEIRKAAVKAIYKLRVNNKTGGGEVDEETNLGTSANGLGYPLVGSSPDPMSATPGDFILAYGEKEAIEITNIDDASRDTPNFDKIWMAIQDANSLIDSYIHGASKSCVRLVSSNRRRTALIIARYYLDTVRRREDVFKDYELCMKELKSCDDGSPDRPGDRSANEDRRGVMRTFSVPQQYNGVTRKGLETWWIDDNKWDFPVE